MRSCQALLEVTRGRGLIDRSIEKYFTSARWVLATLFCPVLPGGISWILAMLLVSDVWQLILPHLSVLDIHLLKCSGARSMLRELSRRKTALFCCARIPLAWPSDVTPNALFSDLSIVIRHSIVGADRLKYKDFVDIHKLPRHLVTLKLNLITDSLPFISFGGGSTSRIQQEFSECLPNLLNLSIHLHDTGAEWVIPDSVTRFDGSGAHFTRGCLPPGLRYFDAGTRHMTAEFWASMPLTLESIDNGNLDELRTLPHLTHFHGRYSSPSRNSTQLTSKFPSLTSLALIYGPYAPLTEWMPPKLTSLEYFSTIMSTEVSLLPRSLTKIWNNLYCSEPFTFAPIDIPSLPPALRWLKLQKLYDKKLIPSDLMNTFPSGLTYLDAPWVLIRPEQIAKLPHTLTSLHTHNLTTRAASNLVCLPRLTELGMYGGTLEAKIAKLLPRQLSSLTLCQVALRTKGHYQAPGSSEYILYSATNPQLSAFKHLPPLLSKLVLVAHGDHAYYIKVASKILEMLPSTLQTLGLKIWNSKIKDDLNDPLAGSEVVGSAEADEATANRQLAQQAVGEAICKAISKFKYLNHLHLNTPYLSHGGGELLAKSLPKSITALHAPSISAGGFPHLPQRLKFFSPDYYSQNAHATNARFHIISPYNAYHGALRRPSELHYMSYYG